MHVFYAPRVNQLTNRYLSHIGIEECLNFVRSDRFKETIDLIRCSHDNLVRQRIKRNGLPIVIPSIDQSISSWLDDESIHPNGVMQFDLDLKDNQLIDIEHVKAELAQRPSTLFVFNSPGGGLKFARKTDFVRLPDETFSDLQQRFRNVYSELKVQVERELGVQLDMALSNIKQTMYLSYDVDAYFNSNCELTQVQSISAEGEQRSSYAMDENGWNGTLDLPAVINLNDFVSGLLQFIPPDISYNDALPINYTVLSILGETGIKILSDHWVGVSKTDRSKLKSMLGNLRYSDLGIMINAARRHVKQNDRKKLESFLHSKLWQSGYVSSPDDYIMPPLKQRSEGEKALKDAIKSFFLGNSDMFIKASGGIGKTKAVLQKIIDLAPEKKVLILVPNYDLAEQMKTDLIEMSDDQILITVPKGTNKSCTNSIIKKEYDALNHSVPSLECLHNCVQKDKCDYVLSRSNDAHVRIMTHEELFNEQSIWHFGYTNNPSLSKYPDLSDRGLLPLRTGWRPDFIVVDEMAIRSETLVLSFNYSSVRKILDSIERGQNEQKSIQNAASSISADLNVIALQKQPHLKDLSRSQFIKEQKKYLKRQSDRIILNVLFDIASSSDENLGRLEFDLEKFNIYYHRLKPILPGYQNVPTLYLDATATYQVISSVNPDIDFREIMVKKRPDIKLKMFSNLNFSRTKLSNTDAIQSIASTVRPYIKDCNDLAIISYKKLDNNCNFVCDLADELGVSHTRAAYFGSLRGLNNLADVSQIFVIGRQWLNQTEYSKLYQAIYGTAASRIDLHKVDQSIRMSNGTSRIVKSSRYFDDRLHSIHQHFGASETIQAIMRGRPIYGSPKEIIFFGSNALDSSLEFDDILFDFKRIGLSSHIDDMKRRGFVKLSHSELKLYGVSRHKFETYRLEIERYLQSCGATIHEVCLFKNKRDMKPNYFAIFDFKKTLSSWRSDHSIVKSIDGISLDDHRGPSMIKPSSIRRLETDNHNQFIDPLAICDVFCHDSDGGFVM